MAPDTTLAEPSAARPLRWWSAASIATLTQRLDGCVRAWATRWEASIDDLALFNAHEVPVGAPNAWTPWLGHATGLHPWAWVSDGDEPPALGLARALFGRTTEGTVAHELAGRAWVEFGDELARRLGQVASAAAGPFGAPSARLWGGDIALRLQLRGAGSFDLWLRVDGDSAARLLRDQARPAARALPPVETPVLAAIAARSVTLRVELAPVEVDLGTLQSLRVGDVLTLPHRLEQPLDLHAPDAPATVACTAYLGSRDGRRAVELIPSSPR